MQIVEEKSIPRVGDSIYSISEAFSDSLPNSMHGVNMDSLIKGEQTNKEKLHAGSQAGSPVSKRKFIENKAVQPDRRKDALRSIYSKISS